MHKVFVYGTLLSGQRNNHLLHSARSLGAGCTLNGGWTMYNAGAFPVLVPDSAGDRVVGEVYEVDHDTFRRLDALEGYPRVYNRRKVGVMVDGTLHNCWVYFIATVPDWAPTVVPNNDWRASQ